MVLDVETDSKIEKLANLYGVGVCFNENKAFYIVWRDQDGNEVWSPKMKQKIKNWIMYQAKHRKLVGHNLIYDILVLENESLDLTPLIYSDTILQKHTIDEEKPFGLKEVSVKLLGDWADKAQDKLKQEVLESGGSWNSDQKDMYLASTTTLGEYCCWDVVLTYLLFVKFEQQLVQEELFDFFYNEEVMPLYRNVTIPMKRRGFAVDMDHFNQLKQDIDADIKNIEDSIYNDIEQYIKPFEKTLLEKDFPVKAKGKFPKIFAEVLGIPLPQTKAGKVTMAAKAIEKQKEATPHFREFYDWVLGKTEVTVVPEVTIASKVLFSADGSTVIDEKAVEEAQRRMYFEKHPDRTKVFNLSSNDHLIELFFNIWGLKPLTKTDKGKPQVNDSFLESQKGNPVIDQLIDLKKLNKLKSTYIEGILSRQVDGIIYTSMLQFGTTSGRYSSRNPNLQNLPRPIDESDADEVGISLLVLKYVNAIREGLCAPKGYKVIDADYSALEPRCFAHVSGDPKLQGVFINGEDLYSRIAIDVFKLKGVSAIPGDTNYLKKVNPEFRQKAKVFCLAVVYGAEESRISQAMKVDYKTAANIINAYLRAYPGLKRYMNSCDYEVKTQGKVKTEFGRVRHLAEAASIYTLYGPNIMDYKKAKKSGQSDLRRKLKNCLNNGKNFKIQGLAAHIVNRAAIAIAKQFVAEGLDAYIALQVHDQLIAIAREDQAERVKEIMRDKMENTTKISIPLIAEPEIANNIAESH
jgi:DNA polymerase I-like protein with 3'-5' exonuclease and polymerase domains